MKYIDEYRDSKLIGKVARQIRRAADPGRTYTFMEVCGTHTMSIFRWGLRNILPERLRLISGPGCPVCVTPNVFLDTAIALGRIKSVIITTFGDMLKVPGSRSSLERERSRGSDIRVVYSTTDALALAGCNRGKEVVFLGVGFETTAPTIAEAILIARKEKIRNFSVLCGHKTMPAALEVLAGPGGAAVNGFLLPGHVSAIIGTKPYGFLSGKYCRGGVVAGFEPLDIMQAILMLVRQKRPAIQVQYGRVIRKSGNVAAQAVMAEVFRACRSEWRGIGSINGSGLAIRDKLAGFDAARRFTVKVPPPKEAPGCICGAVLKGTALPYDCGLFAKRCDPENPVGACMVSGEGTCAAYYKYGAVSGRLLAKDEIS